MSNDKRKRYYLSMMNILRGLEEDFALNEVPVEAKGLLSQLIEICEEDYHSKYDH
jgi:hypothetical protein